MKTRISKKEAKRMDGVILAIGYCKLATLLINKAPFAYSCGVYGWSCDYYDINGVCISTGYTPIGKRMDYNLVNEYERKAQEVINNSSYSYEGQVSLLNALLNEFIEKATK